MKFEVTILGSSSATPIFNRNPTAQVLNINERLYLVDCAEGTQQQMLRFDIKASRIDYIFISHLHGDHYLGLVGLLSSMHLNGRKKPMKLFCPPALKEIIDLQLKYSETTLHYPLESHHTTALQAADVALKTNAAKLIIGHFSARYKTLNELLDEAQSLFPNTELATEGKTFVIAE
jgi:ribonuclease BN (tRNA processing enzyme)